MIPYSMLPTDGRVVRPLRRGDG